MTEATAYRKAPAIQEAQQPSALDFCLSCWAEFMRRDDRDLGVSHMKLRGRGDNEPLAYIERDPYEEQRRADIATGSAVNAMVDSLESFQRWAIYKSRGITTQWRFPSVDYATVLDEARTALELKLRKNIATRIHFL